MNEQLPRTDYHTHSVEHGLEKPRRVREMVQAAVNTGLSSICLTDHYPLPPGFVDPTEEKDCAMTSANYPIYQQEATQAIEEFRGRINVRRGAEVDWLQGYADWTRQEIAKWPFDYVMGSVHFLGRISDSLGDRELLLDYKEDEFNRGIVAFGGIRPLVVAYYGQVEELAKSGIFDGLGHIDLVKKYNDGSLFRGDENWYREAVTGALDAVAEAGMSIEINTSGIDKKAGEAYPSLWVLREARARDIPVTTSSDGHVPESVGRNLLVALDLAKAAGYDRIVDYDKRVRIPLAI